MATLPAMVNGKTRRPNAWMRDDVPTYDPRNDPGMGAVAFFEYREDAVAAAREWCQGWDVHPQYVGRYDLWMLEARRKSWSSTRHVMVMACLHPEREVVRHAHVPMTYSYDRIGG